MAISVSSPFSWAAEPGAWGWASLGAGFLYRILSCLVSKLLNREPEGSLCWVLAFSTATCLQLVWSPNWLIRSLRAPSDGRWLSLPHLVSNWLNFLCTELYNSSTSTFFLWPHKLHSFNPSTVKAIFCYSSTGCTCYLHRCISYFDSPAGSKVNLQHVNNMQLHFYSTYKVLPR